MARDSPTPAARRCQGTDDSARLAPMVDPLLPRRPSLPVRAAAGAWHVPAGFGFLSGGRGSGLCRAPRRPRVVLVFLSLVLAVFVGARVEARLAPAPGARRSGSSCR